MPILYGYPSDAAMERVSAGLAVLGGCLVRPGMDDHACPREHRWRHEDRSEALLSTEDLGAAERDLRSEWTALVVQEGETDSEARVLAHALTIVLAASGRLSEARAVYEPVRAARRREQWAALDEIYRRARSAAARHRRRPWAVP